MTPCEHPARIRVLKWETRAAERHVGWVATRVLRRMDAHPRASQRSYRYCEAAQTARGGRPQDRGSQSGVRKARALAHRDRRDDGRTSDAGSELMVPPGRPGSM